MTSPSAVRSPFRPDVLAGKVALITGGGTGIGYQIAVDLGQHGAKVVIFSRKLEVLQKAVEEMKTKHKIEADCVQGDVRNSEDAAKAVQKCVDTYGRLDILINNAAGMFPCPIVELSPKGFKTVMDIDTLGTFNVSHAAIKQLQKSKGSICNISVTFHYSACKFVMHAAAAKAAVDAMTRGMALELGEYGIRVNSLAPGPIVDTVGAQKLIPKDLTHSTVNQVVPLGRFGTTKDISLAVVFLMTEGASWISGTSMIVDGGAWLVNNRVGMSEESRAKRGKL